MKKILFMFILIPLLFAISSIDAKANHYTNFEKLTLTRGKLLSDFTKNELKDYEKKVTKRKFSGWRTHEVNKAIKVSFISETLFSYYNDGYTPIDYHYKLEEKAELKMSFSATGSIGMSKTSSGTGFKNGLNADLKLTAKVDSNKSTKENYDIKFKVDPGTRVDLYVYGEGKITNGYAARYVFWIRSNKGGYEFFELTTSYQRLEKVKI